VPHIWKLRFPDYSGNLIAMKKRIFAVAIEAIYKISALTTLWH